MTTTPTPLTAKGRNGTVTFDGATIVLSRSGLAKLTTGDTGQTLPLTAITGVQFRPASLIGGNGHIEFMHAGGGESSVMFTIGQSKAFAAVRDAVTAALATRQRTRP